MFPDCITRILGGKTQAWCDQHGLVSIDHVLTGREKIIKILGLPEDWQPPDHGDTPPF